MSGFLRYIRSVFLRKQNPIGKNKPTRLSLRQKFPNYKDYDKELVRLLIERAERSIAKGNVTQAIDRYEGFFKQHPENQDIHNRVATLYMKTGNRVKAGRHFYFKEDLTQAELECVLEFEKWCGNSVRKVKYLMYKDNFKFSKLDCYTQKKFRALVSAAIQEVGVVPKFLQSYVNHFTRLDKIQNKKPNDK